MKKIFTRTLTVIALVGSLFIAIFAAPANYSLFGEAQLVSPGKNSPTAAKLRSGATSGHGGIDFTVVPGLTFSDYTSLSTDYFVSAGDCGAGSPRFQFQVVNPDTNAESTIDVYFMNVNLGQTCLAPSWTSSGDLTTVGYVDNIPEAGNTYVPFATAQQTYGNYEVTGIQLVVDSGYTSPDGQTFTFDNVKINSTTYTFESANSCKNGGWQSYTSAPGPFTNQGQCVSYYARGGQ